MNTIRETQWYDCKMPRLPAINFINVLPAAFACADPESAKKTVKLSVYFMLSESERAKAASRTLIKLTPGVNFINVLCARFSYESAFVRLPKPKCN